MKSNYELVRNVEGSSDITLAMTLAKSHLQNYSEAKKETDKLILTIVQNSLWRETGHSSFDHLCDHYLDKFQKKIILDRKRIITRTMRSTDKEILNKWNLPSINPQMADELARGLGASVDGSLAAVRKHLKTLSVIRSRKLYRSLGYLNFQGFCKGEFADFKSRRMEYAVTSFEYGELLGKVVKEQKGKSK